jgi:predicted RNA-binding protein with PIN domain
MAYLVDGHNLIPKIKGMSLAAVDDEERLVELLQIFCRVRRQKLEVYFDNAPAGQKLNHSYGMVMVHFVRQGMPADDAIIARLHRLGKGARNWSVVSSDRRIQSEARACQAQVVSSEDFANQIANALQQAPADRVEEKKLSDAEVEEWLKLFKKCK